MVMRPIEGPWPGVERLVSRTKADVVDDVSFTLDAGEVLGLVGESGSGKTTVALALMGHARRGLKIDGGRRVGSIEHVVDRIHDVVQLRYRRHVRRQAATTQGQVRARPPLDRRVRSANRGDRLAHPPWRSGCR